MFLYRKYVCDDCNSNLKTIEEISNTIEFYEKFSYILKISNADFIALFKYDYSKRYITTNFILSLDKNNNINYYTEHGVLPVTINEVSLKILNSDNSDVHELYMSDLQNNPISLRSIYKKTFKLYWQNIFKKNINPIGYIVLAYENEYKISEKDKELITDFIKKIAILL